MVKVVVCVCLLETEPRITLGKCSATELQPGLNPWPYKHSSSLLPDSGSMEEASTVTSTTPHMTTESP